MTLPKLNSDPKYSMAIPSTGVTVRYRPYLVKEEKVLLLALEADDNMQMLNAIVDTIDACVEEEIEVNKLTSFDIEYMFTKIRTKATGETARIGLTCVECNSVNEVAVNLDGLTVEMPDQSNMIDLDGTMQLEMQWPSFKRLTEISSSDTTTQADQLFEIVMASLCAIHTEDNRIDFKDYTKNEISDFLESMNSDQFTKIREWIEAMPGLKHHVQYTCINCQHENETTLEGMQAFFE